MDSAPEFEFSAEGLLKEESFFFFPILDVYSAIYLSGVVRIDRDSAGLWIWRVAVRMGSLVRATPAAVSASREQEQVWRQWVQILE